MPRLSVSARCWTDITRELERVAPAEAVLVPVVQVVRRDDPWRTAGLHDVVEVRLVEVVRVAPDKQRNGSAYVSVVAGTDPDVDRAVLRLTRRMPALRTAAYLHSHPFSRGRTFASGTDHRGHMIPLLARNEAAGLGASFSFIACRDGTGRGWRLQCFALDRAAPLEVVDAGFCTVEADDSSAMRGARLPGVLQRERAALRAWRTALRRRGWRVCFRQLLDGWVRARVDVDTHRTVAVFFPHEFGVSTRSVRTVLVDRRVGHSVPASVVFDEQGDALAQALPEEAHAFAAAG